MSDETQFSEMWEDALRVYQVETSRDLLRDKALNDFHTTDDLLAHLEAQEGKFKTFLDKKNKLWSLLKAFMEPVKFLGDATQAFIQGTPFASAGAIFTALSYLIKSAKGVSDGYASIIELLESLADFSDRLNEYAKDVIDTKLRKKITLILATLLEIIAKSETAMSRGRVKEFARAAFLGKDDGVADAVTRLQILVESEGRYVTAKTLSTTQKLNKDVNRISLSLVESRRKKFEETGRKIVDDILYSDAAYKVAEIQARNSNERQSGSGDWLKDEKLYMSWLKSEVPVLWILGGPGSGKSFLASTVVSYLIETYSQVQGPTRVSIGYFYIQENDSQLRSLNTILKNVAYQLQEKDAVYAKYLMKSCSNLQKTITAVDTWTSLFLNYFGSSQFGDKQAFIIIDGVDEAPRKEREILFRLLKDLEDSSKGSTRLNIQVLLIGRPDLRDDTVFIWEKPIIYIEVSARKTKDDILAYIKSSVGRVRALKQARESLDSRLKLRKEIILKLSDGANGMFLWVNLMLDEIYNMSRPSDINKALNNAPISLSKMIRHIFERLEENLRGFRKDDFKEILAWVTCAQRPLKLTELKNVLQLRPPLGEGVPDLEERLRGQFASFFTLTRRDGLTTEALSERAMHTIESSKIVDSNIEAAVNDNVDQSETDDDEDDIRSGAEFSDVDLPPEAQISDPYTSDFSTTVVQFSHASIRDYLVRESDPAKREFPADLGISIDIIQAEIHITITCLQILTDILKLPTVDDSDSDESDDGNNSSDGDNTTSDRDNEDITANEEIKGKEEMYPVRGLMKYAANNFIKHLSHVQKSSMAIEDEEVITRSLLRLFTDNKAIKHLIGNTDDLAILATDWLAGAKYAEFIRGWFLNQILNNDHYLENEVEQMKKLAESDRELLRPLALECNRQWLTVEDDDTDVEGFVSFLDIYVSRDEDKDESASVKADTSESITDIPEARLQKLAEFANLEKTSYWHSHLAEALRNANHIDAAIKSFQIAINLNGKNWIAMGRLAFAYESVDLYEMAVYWAQKAVENCPKIGHKYDRSRYWETIANGLIFLDDLEGAKEAAKEACNIQPESGATLCTYLFVLDLDGDRSELLEYCEGLQARTSKKTQENLLTTALLADDYLLDTLGTAAREVGRLDFIIRAQETAVDAARRGDDQDEVANQQCLLAELYFTHLSDQKKAMDLWELLSKDKDTNSETLESALSNLSMLYYAEAMAAEKAGKKPRHWITKLEGMAQYDYDTHKTSNSGASLILGLWYREHDNIAEARNCCRTHLIQSLDMLNDTDPYNDNEAWYQLSESLLKAGDRVNALAAYATLGQEIDRLKAAIARRKSRVLENSGNPDTANSIVAISTFALVPTIAAIGTNSATYVASEEAVISDNSDLLGLKITSPIATNGTRLEVATSKWFCSGECRREVEELEALYVCEICLYSVSFCQECIHLIKEDKLSYRLCSPQHIFYQMYPVRKGMGKREDGMVLVGGEDMKLEVWLKRLKDEWIEDTSTK